MPPFQQGRESDLITLADKHAAEFQQRFYFLHRRFFSQYGKSNHDWIARTTFRKKYIIMTKADFVEKIENGSDIMFSVAGRQFTILTWTDDGIAISEQYPNDCEIQYYDTAEDLVECFWVDGKPLGEIVCNIIITQYS